MSIAYVIEQNASVNREGERLLIKKDRTVLHTLHIFKLDQIVLFGNVFLTPAAISFLLRMGIDTVFMSRNGHYRGRLQPPHSKNITLRCEQFKRLSDPQFCLEAARSFVSGKTANLRYLLMRLNRTREKLGLEDHILGLRQLGKKLNEAQDLDSLRGYEGRGSALYFEGFAKGFLSGEVQFTKRVRRPPTDPVNALLSLGYTLLFNTVMAAVNEVGFDPYLGCLHTVEYGRPSLALDLMEEWRPVIVDSLVLSVFNLRTITLQDFVIGHSIDPDEMEEQEAEDAVNGDPLPQVDQEGAKSARPVRLTDLGFRKFITQFERKMAEKVTHPLTNRQVSYRDCIREQVRHFARYVKGDEQYYQPMTMR